MPVIGHGLDKYLSMVPYHFTEPSVVFQHWICPNHEEGYSNDLWLRISHGQPLYIFMLRETPDMFSYSIMIPATGYDWACFFHPQMIRHMTLT
jgi:hypothetical protein